MSPYYNHGGIVIYHGDCREILPTLQAVDLVLTDPPYGIGADEGQMARAGKQDGNAAAPSRDYGISGWDSKPPEDWVFGLFRSKSRYQIIFGGNYFQLPLSRCWLVWDKQNGTNDYADAELAWLIFLSP